MKLLKLGKEKCDKWIGECTYCKTIYESDTSELQGNIQLNNKQLISWKICDNCNSPSKTVCFYEQNTPDGRILLSKIVNTITEN